MTSRAPVQAQAPLSWQALSWQTLTAFDAIHVAADPEDEVFWIAGHGGLHRYAPQGGSWQTYTTAHGLSKIWAETVLVEPEVVWVGTEDGGANRFDRSTQTFTPFLQDEAGAPLTVWAFQTDEDYVWAGTNRGLFQVDRATLQTVRQYTEDDGLGSNDVTALVDDGEHLWIATSFSQVLPPGTDPPKVGGLSRLHKATGDVAHFTLPGDGSDYLAALSDAGDTLWAGGREGLFIFDKTQERFTPVVPDVIEGRATSILVAEDEVWCTAIPATQELLFRIDRGALQLVDEPLALPEPSFGSSARVTHLAAGPQYVMAVRGEHLLRISIASGEAKPVPVPLLPYPYTDGIAGSDGITFAGSNDVLIKISADLDVIEQRTLFDDLQKKIQVIRVDGADVWVGTFDGLVRLRASDLATKRSFFPTAKVRVLEMDAPYAWTSPGVGLYRIDTRTNDSTAIPLGEQLDLDSEPEILAVVPGEAQVWIAYTDQRSDGLVEGVARMDRSTLAVTATVEADEEEDLTGLQTLIETEDYLWAGANTITRLSKTDLSAEAFVDHKARLLRAYDGYLWAVSGSPGNGEVRVYDLSDPGAGTLLTLDESAGLPHDYVTDLHFTEDDRYAWMTTYAGISVLDLSSVEALPADELTPASPLRMQPSYPNPFATATTIPFAIDQPGRVRLVVHDLLGREVTSLHDGWLPAGRHHVRWEAHGVAAGLYLARLCVETSGTDTHCEPTQHLVHVPPE